MAPPSCNNNNPQMEIAMHQMIEAQTQLTQLVTQNTISNNNSELPSGVQQLLDAHIQIVQMMSQNIFTSKGILSQKSHGSKEIKDSTATSRRACKACGEIGHTFKECEEQCLHCDASHPNEECPTTQISCVLCEGTNHVPAQCQLYSTVQRMNQQRKDGIFQFIGKIQEDTKTKRNAETEVMSQEVAHTATTKCCYTCGEEGHISCNCTRKRERFPTFVIEYEDHELQGLLALEKPKRKKRNNSNKKGPSQVICHVCH